MNKKPFEILDFPFPEGEWPGRNRALESFAMLKALMASEELKQNKDFTIADSALHQKAIRVYLYKEGYSSMLILRWITSRYYAMQKEAYRK